MRMQRAGLDTGFRGYSPLCGHPANLWGTRSNVFPTDPISCTSFRAAAALLILLFWPATVYAQSETERTLVVSSVVLSGFADWATTRACLSGGTCREANPALQWAVTSGTGWFTVTKAVSTAAIAYLTHWLYTHGHAKWGRILGIGASATWGTAAVLNLRYVPRTP